MSAPEQPNDEAEIASLVAGALELLGGEGAKAGAGLRQRPAESEEAADPTFGRLHAAAAVLSSFERAALQPAPADVVLSPADDDILDVLADSAPVRDAEGRPRWRLLPDVRRQLLRRFDGPKA